MYLALQLTLELIDGQVSIDARQQLFGLKWLRYVVHSSRGEAFELVFNRGQDSHENDRDIFGLLVCLQATARLKSVDTRHLHIQQDQVRLGQPGALDPRL